jgi:hypothetical protein
MLAMGFASFLSFSGVGLIIMFATLHTGVLFGALIAVYLGMWMLQYRVSRHEMPTTEFQHPYTEVAIGEYIIVSSHYFWIVLYVLIWLFGMVMVFANTSTAALHTPWQSLDSLYIASVCIGGMLLVASLFSKIKTSIILGMLVLQSMLMHAYIPASHVLPWGGDVWRHIGRVEHVLAEESIRPILFGTDIAMHTVGGFDIPAVFLHSQQYAYNMHWGSLSLLHTATGISLEVLSIWLIPILWSILVPVLCFYIGYMLFGSTRKGLLFSFIMLLPFSFQALGSLTLPVSFGYLVFLCSFLILLFAIRYHTRILWYLVLLLAVYMCFVYPVHAVIFAYISAISYILRSILTAGRVTAYRIAVMVSVIVGVLLIVGIELIAGTSSLPKHIPVFSQITKVVGEFSGYYIASAIRPHDILSGNIFFNHTPSYAYVQHIFSSFRWHIVLFQLTLFGLAAYGIVRAWSRKRHINMHIFSILTTALFISYCIGWYILVGDRQFIRRMDAFLAWTLLGMAWYGYLGVLGLLRERIPKQYVQAIFILSCIGIVWVTMTTFTSGPDMRVVSRTEYDVAKQLYTVFPKETCIVANTWELLVVESLSKNKVIGGGFPIDAQYGQPARIDIYNRIVHTPDAMIVKDVRANVSALTCMFVLPMNETTVPLSTYIDMFGTPIQVFGSYVLWRVELQEPPRQVTIVPLQK